MHRFTLLAAVVSLISYGQFATADEPKKPSAAEHATATPMIACAKACGECALACDMCAAYCATMLAEGKREHLKVMQTCQDCAAICGTAACIMAKNGPFSDLICTACADACKRCGDACEAMKDDAMMKKCAEECRKCETACRAMLKTAPAK